MSRILVTMKDGDPHNAESGVFDMDTGKKIDGVVSVNIRPIDPDTAFVLADITAICDLNIECNAEIDERMKKEFFADPEKPVAGKVVVSVRLKKFRVIIAAIMSLIKTLFRRNQK